MFPHSFSQKCRGLVYIRRGIRVWFVKALSSTARKLPGDIHTTLILAARFEIAIPPCCTWDVLTHLTMRVWECDRLFPVASAWCDHDALVFYEYTGVCVKKFQSLARFHRARNTTNDAVQQDLGLLRADVQRLKGDTAEAFGRDLPFDLASLLDVTL